MSHLLELRQHPPAFFFLVNKIPGIVIDHRLPFCDDHRFACDDLTPNQA